jgi:hypothetical protein
MAGKRHCDCGRLTRPKALTCNQCAQIKSRYGLSFRDWQRLYEEQGGRCRICQKAKKKLFVDHDHTTKTVRGLLCPSCNTAIGILRSQGLLRRAIAYLECVEEEKPGSRRFVYNY